MAYGAEQDRLRALLPEGFLSLRPVLRFNAEIRDGQTAWLEFNTAVEWGGVRGWLNIAQWESVPFTREGKKVCFRTEKLDLAFTRVGIEGGCPAEKDNAGCFFSAPEPVFRPAESISVNKEFCDCDFVWHIPNGAHGVSLGKTLPAVPEPVRTVYPRLPLTAENAAVIPCTAVLGAYVVEFER